MFQLRRILLSGLVALLMVGMVTASELVTPGGGDEVDTAPFGLYLGMWDETRTQCLQTSGGECLSFWISWDISWLSNLFN